MNREDKINILISALWERYNSIHIIRERVHSTSIWLLWLLLWISGWIIQSKIDFSCKKKLFFITLAVMTFFIIKFFYYSDLERWFMSQRKVASKIEEELWLYDDNNSIYPISWKDNKKWNFFLNNYILIWFWFLVLITVLIFFT